jgi:hypothetical protein
LCETTCAVSVHAVQGIGGDATMTESGRHGHGRQATYGLLRSERCLDRFFPAQRHNRFSCNVQVSCWQEAVCRLNPRSSADGRCPHRPKAPEIARKHWAFGLCAVCAPCVYSRREGREAGLSSRVEAVGAGKRLMTDGKPRAYGRSGASQPRRTSSWGACAYRFSHVGEPHLP